MVNATTIRRAALAPLICTAGMVLGWAAPARAHRAAAPFAAWGAFDRDTAQCQRALGAAAVGCIDATTSLRSACLAGLLDARPCDETALAARIAAARQQSLAGLDRACTGEHLQALAYADRADAVTDLTAACDQVRDALTSAAFAPLLFDASPPQGEPAACVRAAMRETQRVARSALRAYERALDRVAALSLDGGEKTALIAWAQRRIAGVQPYRRAAIAAACPEATFVAAYGQSPEAVLAGVASQAACMAERVYAQDAVRCPAPACGNGMQEVGEACDDGDADETDGCRSDCSRPCAAFDLLQHAIFSAHGCRAGACHGSAQSGGLDLRAGVAYGNLPVASNLDPERPRIAPGNPDGSVLFLKLATKTLPAQYPVAVAKVGNPMPPGVGGVSVDELEALRRWIDAGAARFAELPEVEELLGGCTPPAPLDARGGPRLRAAVSPLRGADPEVP